MKRAAAWLLSLLAGHAMAGMAYVSDELILGVYADENNQGQRLATLHSGSGVEVLSASGDFSQVRLSVGTTGWVKSSFLTAKEPAVVRIKSLQDELDRTRATTPALSEAAARNEVLQLQRELAATQARLEAARDALARGVGGSAAAGRGLADSDGLILPWLLVAALAAAAGLGFWFGYATLARRVRQKFGGLRVY